MGAEMGVVVLFFQDDGKERKCYFEILLSIIKQVYSTGYLISCFSHLGGVSAVYYWPRHPELEGSKDIVKNDLNIVDDLFLRSSTISSVFVPLDLDKGTILKLVKRTMRDQCEEYKSNYEGTWKEDYNLNCNLLNLPDSKDICKRKMEIALQHLSDLLNCSHGEFEEHIHALQLCYLLATRSGKFAKKIGRPKHNHYPFPAASVCLLFVFFLYVCVKNNMGVIKYERKRTKRKGS